MRSMLGFENESEKQVVRREKSKSRPKTLQACQFGCVARLTTWADPQFDLIIVWKRKGDLLPVPFRHLLGVHSVGSMLSLENESRKHVVR